MTPFSSNSECILEYLALFQALAGDNADTEDCSARYRSLLLREQAAQIPLGPRLLRERFSLSERDFLLVMAALAFEMDGALRGGFRRRYGLPEPTLEYGLQLISPICPQDCACLAEFTGQMVLCGLLLAPAALPPYPMERPLILSRAVLAFLTGLSCAGAPGCVPLLPGTDGFLPLHEQAFRQVCDWFQTGSRNMLYLCAPKGTGRRTLLCRACGGAVCVESAALDAAAREAVYREAAVLSVLLGVPVCAEADGRDGLRALERLCSPFCIPAAVLAEDENSLWDAKAVIRLPRTLSAQEKADAWSAFLPYADAGSVPDGAMSVCAVRETAETASRLAAAEGRRRVTRMDTCRAMARRGRTMPFCAPAAACAGLEAMVLPEGVRAQLELLCQSAESGAALADWGLPQAREGVTAVFHGPSGTGKTMAAGAVAARLGMPLLRADLSRIMDQYVGETEKHLAQLLAGARESRCVLLFDEADALFSRRAQVSGGHDKYANLSTAYLLQEIEQYEGVALLSTNLLGSFDDAFLRRLQYIIRFPLPDAGLREQLWRRALPTARLSGNVSYAALAQAELSPARIHACIRSAAAIALHAGRETMDAACIIQALRLELEKDSRPLPHALAGAFAQAAQDGPARAAQEGSALLTPAIFSRKN